MNKWIYLDNAATTKPYGEVVTAMLPFWEEKFGNAGSLYGLGVESNRALNQSRRIIAKSLCVKPEEIFFTSGGTEADNWAITGVAYANQHKGKHIITTKIEHPAVLETCKRLEQQGFSVTYLNVDETGRIDLSQLEQEIRQDTILISVMYANNEVGTIQPIAKIAKIAKKHQVLLHVDAVQAYGHVLIPVKELGIDLLSVSGHKCHGPKGVGFLFCRQYIPFASFMTGGHQETAMRAGTENVPGIVGLAKAVEISMEQLEEHHQKTVALRNYFANSLLEKVPNCEINGDSSFDENKRLAGNLHVSFIGQEAQKILIHLDRKGICASGGSACTARDGKPSHVLVAMGKNTLQLKGAIRFSLGYDNTKEEIDYVVQVLSEYIK